MSGTKYIAMAVVVDDVETYLQNPNLASLSDRVLQVQGSVTAPNPDYAVMSLPPKAVEPVKIPNSKVGDVVFLYQLSDTQYEFVASISNYPGYERIKHAYLALLSGPIHPSDGTQFFDTTGSNLPLGLGLIHLPFNIPDFLPNLPAMVWLVIALVSGYSAYNSKNILPKIGLSAVTWLAAAKFVKTQTNNLKL